MRDIIFLSFLAIFCPFTLLTTQKIKILKKWKEHLEMSSSYTCVPKITIMMYDSWDMECNSHNALSFWATFCPFSPLLKQKKKKIEKYKQNWIYYPFTHVYHKWKSYEAWLLKYKARRTVFCHFGPFFDLWTSQELEKSKFWEIKKAPGHIIILHLCTTNDNQMMYGPEIWRATDKFLSFWFIFCPFTSPLPLTTQKIKLLKKWRK